MRRKYLSIVCILLFSIGIIATASAQVVVVNSRDWKDVYSCVIYANSKDMTSTFLNSESPDTVLKTIGTNEDILVMESETKPYIPQFSNLLTSRGYTVETITFTDANLDSKLIKEIEPKEFILIEESYPYNGIIAAPHTYITKGWVFIVNKGNINEVVSKLSGANKVLALGLFSSDLKEKLGPYVTETISTNSKFTDATEMAKKFISIKPTTQILISDGRYIETEVMSGSRGTSPIILVGGNLLPDKVTEFLVDNKIKTAVIIGNQLSVVGESIRTATNRETVVFIKFGVGRAVGTESTFSALTMFPLPTYEAKLMTEEVFYSPKQEKLFTRFKNDGNVGVFEFTSLTIKSGEEVIGKASDVEPQFIGGGEGYTAPFKVKIPGEKLSENLSVILYTSYGESPNALDNYITETGKFGPPLELPLKIEEIDDSSEIELLSLAYYPDSNKFSVKIKNTGHTTAYVDAEIPEVEVSGITQTLGYKGVKELDPEEETELLITAELTELEVRTLDKQRTIVYYGEKETLLINKIEKELEVKIETGTIGITGLVTGNAGYLALGVIIVVALIAVFYFKRRKK